MAKNETARPEEVSIFRGTETLPESLWTDLAGLDPELVAQRSGTRYENGSGFIIRFLSGDYLVNTQHRTIAAPAGCPGPDFQKGMVLLAYLAQAQDLGLAGRMVSPRELNGGELFFKGPHAPATAPIIERFGSDPTSFLKKAAALGAVTGNDGSGFSFQWLVLPHIALGCVLYPEDDEFPAEVTYTFDAYSHYHLALDGLWAIINVVANEFSRS